MTHKARELHNKGKQKQREIRDKKRAGAIPAELEATKREAKSIWGRYTQQRRKDGRQHWHALVQKAVTEATEPGAARTYWTLQKALAHNTYRKPVAITADTFQAAMQEVFDLRKAYDSVPHDLLFRRLEEARVGERTIRTLRAIYNATTTQVFGTEEGYRVLRGGGYYRATQCHPSCTTSSRSR